MTKIVHIWTDGACSGNPGPGGWGAVLRYGGSEKELSGAAAIRAQVCLEFERVKSFLDQHLQTIAVQ